MVCGRPDLAWQSGDNFINLLRERFLYESALRSFSLLHFGFKIFWQKYIGEKSVHEMLMKLTPGVNFIKLLFSYCSEKLKHIAVKKSLLIKIW